MKLVVLDGHTLNPGDLSWDALQALAPVEIFPRTAPRDVAARAGDAELVLTNKVVLDRAAIAALPKLRYIGVLATGYNVVDVAAARERGIVVTNVPEYSTRSVAQMVFALLLELCHHAGAHSGAVRAGRWTSSPDFAFWDFPLVELDGRTLGIVGLGRIGKAVAALGQAFGMKVLAYQHRPKDVPAGVAVTSSLDALFRESDVVTLHCPLTAETKGLVNAARLALMKRTAFLINTGRGPLVEEQDLADALNAGRIAGAGLDVLSQEPPPASNPLLAARNCVITPHCAWATHAARGRLMTTVVENVRAFLAGAPRNVVS
jgi:glycerate dehydrogenase